jgi:hypothetical protein
MAKYEVIVKTDVNDRPKDHELSAALILANYYFKADVVFLRPLSNHTPDIDVNGVKWEIKSPMGNGKKTIDNNFRMARKQSRNIVIDLRRIKMHQSKANARIRSFLSTSHRFKRVIVIAKDQRIVEIL